MRFFFFLWTPTHRLTGACWRAKTFTHQLLVYTECRLEYLPRVIADRYGWWESKETVLSTRFDGDKAQKEKRKKNHRQKHERKKIADILKEHIENIEKCNIACVCRNVFALIPARIAVVFFLPSFLVYKYFPRHPLFRLVTVIIVFHSHQYLPSFWQWEVSSRGTSMQSKWRIHPRFHRNLSNVVVLSSILFIVIISHRTVQKAPFSAVPSARELVKPKEIDQSRAIFSISINLFIDLSLGIHIRFSHLIHINVHSSY